MPVAIGQKIRFGIGTRNAGARVRRNRAGRDRIAFLKREMNGLVETPVGPQVMAALETRGTQCGSPGRNGQELWQGTARMKDSRLGRPPGAVGALLFEQDLFFMPVLDLESPVEWVDWRRPGSVPGAGSSRSSRP